MGIFRRLRVVEQRIIQLEAKLEAHAKDHNWQNYTREQEERVRRVEKLAVQLLDKSRTSTATDKKDPEGDRSYA